VTEEMSGGDTASGSSNHLREELVQHFRDVREILRLRWVELMTEKGLLPGLSPQEIETESVTIYDTCVNCLATDSYADAEAYAARMAGRGVLQGMTSEQILGGMLTLRDVYGRSLFERYQNDMTKLFQALDLYEPVANKILAIVALAFIQEREKVVREQQEAIRELSTPVLALRAEGLLMLPIIGMIDTQRARQLTEQLLSSIREHRARVVVLDITGVPIVDSKIANHLVQTVEASRLMGAQVIISGLSPEIAQTLVTIGVDLSRLNAVVDLQAGIEIADRLIGYKVERLHSPAPYRADD
jgi:rsbT co-antagonist protein RsbR